MEIRSRSYQTAQTSRLVHDPACILDAHSAKCYLRETDRHTVTEFYGIESIEGVEHVVTGPYATAQGVPQPTAREVAARVGADRLIDRLNVLMGQRAGLDATANAEAVAALDVQIARLRGLLP